ncbi:MAG: NAD-binding protein, partial [Polyangiales bacterium]
SVWLSTVRSGLSIRERIFLSATAPRGVVAAAVSSLFALELVETGYEEASILMPVTFVVIALTVLTSGLSAVPLLNRLGLAQKKPQGVLIVGADRVGRTIAMALRQHEFPVLLVDSDPGKVEEAKSLGLEVVKGEVLSRRVLRSLDLDGIGHLLALTPNDDVNTLAAAHFVRLFGADNVHQIQPSSHRGRPMPGYASQLTAQAFAGGATLGKLQALARSGASVTVSPVDETPTLERMRDQLGLDAVPLFAVSDEGELSFIHSDEPLPSAAKLVVLTPP